VGGRASVQRIPLEELGFPKALTLPAREPILAGILEQFSPLLRRLERLRFSSLGGRASVARHEELIRFCAEGDAERAAALAFDTWHSLAPPPEE
jgi:DNA-binding GntR family transcriptional regulator